MALSNESIAELEKFLKKARQKDLPFGLCLGKKPEDNVMVMDLKKSSEVLMRTAKQDGETGKVTHGMVSVKGKIISVTLGGKMLPGLAKNMKTFLMKNSIKMKVVILDADGTELESDGDEDQEAGNDTAEHVEDTSQETVQTDTNDNTDEDAVTADTASEDDPLEAKWTDLYAELDGAVKNFAASNDPKAAAIAKAWDGGITAAGNGDYKVAVAVAAKIKPVVLADGSGKPTGAPENDANAAKWEQVKGPIEALYKDIIAQNPTEAAQLTTIWNGATGAAGNGDYAKAMAIIAKLKPMLDAAKAAGPTAAPADPAPFQKSKAAWSSAREKMRAEVDQLVTAIKDACGNSDDLQPVVQQADGLHKHLDGLDDNLDIALDAVLNAPDGPQRAAAMQGALKAIEALESGLQQPFFKDVDSNNGFKSVKVTETASKSLAAIAKIIDTQAKAAA